MIRNFALILFCFTAFEVSAYPQPTSKRGCLRPSTNFQRWNCTEQTLFLDILRRLRKSKDKKKRAELEKMITDRSRYYLSRNKHDYLSVLSLLMFPIKRRENFLAAFAKISGRPVLDKIVAQRLEGKKPSGCHKTRYYQEICKVKIYTN